MGGGGSEKAAFLVNRVRFRQGECDAQTVRESTVPTRQHGGQLPPTIDHCTFLVVFPTLRFWTRRDFPLRLLAGHIVPEGRVHAERLR